MTERLRDDSRIANAAIRSGWIAIRSGHDAARGFQRKRSTADEACRGVTAKHETRSVRAVRT
jgi:hypothetical protein